MGKKLSIMVKYLLKIWNKSTNKNKYKIYIKYFDRYNQG